jgi:hypothetical protein
MALIKCEECSNEISNKASSCPKCGNPTTHNKEDHSTESNVSDTKGGCLTPLILFLVVGGIISWFIYLNYIQEEPSANLVNKLRPITYEKQVQVQEDQYYTLPIKVENAAEVTIEYLVKSGPNIDVFFVDEEGLKEWQRMLKGDDGSGVSYYSELSTFGTSESSVSESVNEGTYYLIFDNTDYGPTYPPMNMANDISTLDLVIKIQY